MAELNAQTDAEPAAALERLMPQLGNGKEVLATIAGKNLQIYDIPMEKGQYLELIVKQKTVDVIATLFNPQGKQVMESDFTGRSKEFVLLIAEQKGNYRLQVRRYEQDAIRGDYGVQVVAVRSAGQSDKAKASAYQSGSQALKEGLELLKVGQPASSQQALTKFKTALSSFQGLQQPAVIGVALKLIGDSYSSLKEYPQALDAYQQALTNHRQANELVGEAYALQGIGAVYAALGNNIKASEYILSTLELYRRMPGRLWDLRGALQQLAIIYRESKKYAQVITVLKEVLLLDRQLKDNQGEGLTLYVLGMTYKDVGQNQEAINAYEQSLKIYQQLGQKDEQKAIIEALADIYQRQENQAKAKDYQRQAIAMANQPQKINPSPPSVAQKLFDEGLKAAEDKTPESMQQAIAKLEAALPLLRQATDKAQEALALELLALVYRQVNEYDKAKDCYQQLLPLIRKASDPRKEAIILNEIGDIYRLKDNPSEAKKALRYYQESLLLSHTIQEPHIVSESLNDIGQTYLILELPKEALTYLQQALAVSREVKSPLLEAQALNLIAATYFDTGNIHKAIEFFQSALVLVRSEKNTKGGEQTILLNLARAYSATGEAQKSLDYIQLYFQIGRQRVDRGKEFDDLIAIGRIYNDLGSYNKSTEYYQKALLVSRMINDRSREATAHNNLANVFRSLGMSNKALGHLEQSLHLARETKKHALEAVILNGLGAYYWDRGERRKALEYYEKALLGRRAVSDRAGEATILNNIGNVYSALGEGQKALDYLQQSLLGNRDVGDRSGEAYTLSNIARLEKNRGNLQVALQPIQESIAIVEELRTKIIDPDLRQSYFTTVQDQYQFYIELLMELHQQNPSQAYDKQAFNISERSRARTLLELLTEAGANLKEGVDPQLLAQEKSLLGQLDATEKRRIGINSNPKSNPEQKANIDNQYKDLQTQYQTLQNQIRAKSPKYAALKYPQPLNLTQVQKQLLDSDTTLLQYSLGKEKSFLWVVSRDGLQSHVLPPEKEIEAQVKSWRSSLLDKPETPETLDGPASRLGRLLLEPAAAALKSRRRVIVVPDGPLTYAPFAALRLEGKPLVESHTLLQLPSSSTLALIRSQTAQRLPAPRGLAMVADPIFSGDDPRLTTPVRMSQAEPTDLASLNLQRASRALPRQRSAINGASDSLPRLPGTRREAERILPLFPGNQTLLALDSQASLALLQSPSMKDYRYVHLATHGVFNTAEPALSGVILSLVDQQGRAVNGFLRLNEIFNLNLPAELVVLSACETGLGEQIRGEGMVGLTRGFLYAGSRRLLVSLWKVDDDATAALMSRFYDGLLREKLTPAQSLRAAQNHLRTNTNWDSPYFWSGFVLQGEW